MRTRRQQHVAVKHEGVPRHNGNDGMVTVRLHLGTEIALSDAAEVLAGLLIIEVRERQRLPCLALERHGFAIRHAEPLVGNFDIGSRARGRVGTLKNILPCLGSNREHGGLTLVGTHILRLGKHARDIRLRKLKRDHL